MLIYLLSLSAPAVCVCTSVHGMSVDLPLQWAAVIGCDTILSALPGGFNRNVTIMALVMNMSRQLQTKALIWIRILTL